MDGIDNNDELATERWRVRSARKCLQNTVDNMPGLEEDVADKRKTPEFAVSYLEETIHIALGYLDAFAEAEPDFINWC